MTNHEAIRLIRNLPTMCEFADAYGEPIDSDAYYEAVDMAISALQAQDSPKPTAGSVQNVQNEDLISRKAAIDAVCLNNYHDITLVNGKPYTRGYRDGVLAKENDCIENIMNLPSAQPEVLACGEGVLNAQPEPHWIPVSERLPEYGVAVLTYDGHCFCVEKRIPTIRDDEGEPITGDWWVSDDYDEYDSDYYPNLRDGACIAWMPLPTAYREDGGE